jgi:hypothetical protein
MRIMTSRAIATAAAVLLALTTMSLQPAAAGWRHGEEAAALTAFAVVLGTIAAIVAAERDRDQPAYAPGYHYDPDHDPYARGRYYRGPVHGRHEPWRDRGER